MQLNSRCVLSFLIICISSTFASHHHRSRHHRDTERPNSRLPAGPRHALFTDSKFVVVRPNKSNSQSAEVIENNWNSVDSSKLLYDHLFFPLIPVENHGMPKPDLLPGKHAIKFETDTDLNLNKEPTDIKSTLKKILMRIDA
ncbi:unnamed protein product [Bursaphelenchus okinawaensis]|uniref:Uncharacterized protein n=1 Tax=Bursaphelenchus okinawaensis TaxID=465554 RepID=A0A811LNW6_9BILA|nr:unnamed protein product [Bursaphelenchus okinawaensis]CAG9124994.1 unnamed protein product [Bursaphelenchus okinawaensis]